MKKNMLKRKILSVFLAGALVITSFHMTPALEVHGEKGEGTVYAKRRFDSSYDSQYAYNGDDLGCTYTPEKTTFKVWTPEASAVVLCRYEKGNGGSIIEQVPMTKGDKGVWSVTISGDIVNTYYTYKVTVNGSTKEAVDIYAKAAGVDGDRAMVVDLDSTDPVGWDKNYQREKTLLSDIIVWEIHIRDFSIDASSGVSQENRGKYKAFTEDTTVNGQGRVASCVNYLKELGVTHVQILPMYDYASVDETRVTTTPGSNYNWGYDPKNYNVPEGSYSSNPYDGNVRITEMKEMIQALHDAGIKVIMDVVYNHTYDTADSNFNKIMPDYYYKINDDLSYNNQSGCGNATRSESAMYRKFMIDSVSYWAEEYNLDGFRFDLMGIHDLDTMNQIRKTLDDKFGKDTIVLYGEGWTANDHDTNSAHKANESKLDYGIGYFNDQIRDAIKGEHKYDKNHTIGLVQANYFSGSFMDPGVKWPNNVFGGIMGSVGYTSGEWGEWRPFWSKSSNCSLSYTSAHDNLTLWDKLAGEVGRNFDSTDERMLKMNKMAGSVVLVSKGGVFMQAGEEFARTKYGDDNSYISPDSTNKIDWNRVNTYSSIQKYYQGMISIRKAFSGFRSILTRSGDNWNPYNNNLYWISKDALGLTAFYETNDVPGEWNRIAVLINNATSSKTVNLTGSDSWVIIADGNTAGLEKIKETGSNVEVPAKSVVVAVPKGTFEANIISENKPPVINVQASFQAVAGERLSFTARVSDPDGDKVEITAAGVPQGAVFNTATGEFVWENPVSGSYTIDLTASDGKNQTSKSISIVIKERGALVKEKLEKALLNAKERLSGAQSAPADYDAAAVSDLQTVITEAEGILQSQESPEVYESAAEDLEAAIRACVSLKANPVIRVKAESWNTPAVYVWQGDGASAVELAGKWPGTKLTTKDSEGFYVYDLPVGTTGYSLVVNDGAANTSTQTADIAPIAGSVDITVTSFTGKTCTYDRQDREVGNGQVEIDKTGLSSQISKGEQVVQNYPQSPCLPDLKSRLAEARAVYENTAATQVKINQSVRALKKSIRAVEENREGPEINISISFADESAVYIYDGQEKKPEIIVKDGEQILTEGTDYTVSYLNNINAGTSQASDGKAPTAVIMGINSYEGKIETGNKLTFTIEQKLLADSNVSITGTYTYSGSPVIPTVTVRDGAVGLEKGRDYEIAYSNNINAGPATVTVTGAGNYTGTVQKEFTIEKADIPADAPESQMTVAAGPLSNLRLGSGWEWDEADKDKVINNQQDLDVTVIYVGADKDNYNIVSIPVRLTGIDCQHEDEYVQQKGIKAATCTEDGYSGDTMCTKCNTLIEKGSIISKTGHQWEAEPTVDEEATCTKPGKQSIHCSNCSEVKDEVIIPKTGHQKKTPTVKWEATCTTAGEQYIDCSICGERLEVKVIPPLGHTGGTATCRSQAVCERCGQPYGSYGNIHNWDSGTVTKPATATEDGIRTYTCTECQIEKKTEIIPKTGSTGQTTQSSLKAGDPVTDSASKATYKVTQADATTRTVAFVAPTDQSKTVTIPNTIVVNGITYQVTSIEAGAFKNNKTLSTIKLGSNIKTIGDNAFYGCSNLKKVTLSKNLTQIGSKAFYKCTKLTGITIPAKVSKIGSKAFYGCKNLKKMTIKTTKLTSKKVGSKAFGGIAAKATIKVPKKKLASYKKLLKAKGVGSKATIKK